MHTTSLSAALLAPTHSSPLWRALAVGISFERHSLTCALARLAASRRILARAYAGCRSQSFERDADSTCTAPAHFAHTFPARLVGLLLGIFFAVFSLATTVASAADWQGQVVQKAETPHMVNPAQPIEKPQTVSPKQLWTAGGDDEDNYFFGVLSQITTDDQGNIYLLDSQLAEVFIFSPHGDYIRSIGREGEGPGEFRRPSDLFLTAGGDVAVLQTMPGKIVLLSPEGDPVGNHPVPDPANEGAQMFFSGKSAGENIVLSANQFSRQEAGFTFTSELIAVSPSGEKLATYTSFSQERDFANMEINEKTFGRNQMMWATGKDGKVYTSSDFDAYAIEVWNADGTLNRVIEREYEHRVRSDEEKERNKPRVMFRTRRGSQQPETKASDTDRDIQNLIVREDGTLWVLNSHGAYSVDDGVIARYDVFDNEGRFIEEITVKGEGDYEEDGFHIVSDRLYVVTGFRSAQRAMYGGSDDEEVEDDGEPMSVICYELRSIVASQ